MGVSLLLAFSKLLNDREAIHWSRLTQQLKVKMQSTNIIAKTILIIILTFCSMFSTSAQVLGPDRPFLSVDLGLSILGETGQRQSLARSFALALRGGVRWGMWGIFTQIEPAYWRVSKTDGAKEIQGALNLGIGGELLSAKGLVRSAFSIGPSILTHAGEVDDAGSTGVYFEIRPAGLRWLIADRFVLGLDPIILSIMAPVLEGIPLIELEYRTTIIGEYVF